MIAECKEIISDLNKLGEWCTEIDPKKEGKLCQEIILALKTTMRENKLDYLTAPQIGYDRRLFCIKFGKNDYRTFINPMITNNIGFNLARETCNSIPDKVFIRPRFNKLNIVYTTPLDKVECVSLVGRAAQVFEHCVDHLNGILVSDIGLEIDEDFDNATEEERAEIIKMYIDALDVRQKDLEEQIKEDEDLNTLDQSIKFIESVQKGETKIEHVPQGENNG